MRQKWARRIAFLTGLLVLLLASVFGVTQNPAETPVATAIREQAPPTEQFEFVVLDPERIDAGRQVYEQQGCARCHSVAGKGNPRQPLDGVGARRSAAELRDWIIGVEALQGELPEYVFKLKQAYTELSVDNLDALVIYMQSLRPEINKTDSLYQNHL